jgi:CheY-like chemotaxis protein
VEFVNRLRDADAARQTPIVVTACAFEPDQHHASAAGCNVFLPKPCLPEELVKAIHAVDPTTRRRRRHVVPSSRVMKK